jgi:hypothetical protein
MASSSHRRRLAGAHLRQRDALIEQALHQHLDLPAAFLAAEQARMQHPGVVHHQEVAGAQPLRQLGNAAIDAIVAGDNQQAARRTLRQGRLRHQFRRQQVVEIGEGQGHRWH